MQKKEASFNPGKHRSGYHFNIQQQIIILSCNLGQIGWQQNISLWILDNVCEILMSARLLLFSGNYISFPSEEVSVSVAPSKACFFVL